jgi:phage N-6-adenine-methyltransferase
VLTSSASDEWYTPLAYIELAREVMGGIDLDPASNEMAQVWIKATAYYTQRDNGLAQPWAGRVWLNPPYGTQMNQWIEKAISEYNGNRVEQMVLLVRPAPGSAWYQILSAQFPSCITNRRIRFINSAGKEQASPVHGNVFFYLGRANDRFRAIFESIGVVTRPF